MDFKNILSEKEKEKLKYNIKSAIYKELNQKGMIDDSHLRFLLKKAHKKQ